MKIDYKYLIRLTTLLVLVNLLVSCSGGGGLERWIHEDVNEDFTSRVFGKKALQEDLESLKNQMIAKHPVYNEIIDKKAINAKYTSLKSNIKEGMNRRDFFQLIGKLTPYFNDGHSIIFPLLAEGTYAKNDGQYLFPFGVLVNNESLYINNKYTHKSKPITIEKGTKVLSINGIPGETILKELAQYGHGETANLRMHMSSLLFPYWLNAIYDWKEDFQLVLEFENKQKNITVSNPEDWNKESNDLGDNWLKVMPNKVAYLRLGTFDVSEEAGYEDFVQNAFEEIQKNQLSKLIIDVRGNTGGQTAAGTEILQYLTDKELNQASSAIEKLTEDSNGFLGYKGDPGEIIKIDVTDSNLVKPVEENKRFKGEVIVLIDEMSYSATIVFATTIQDHNLAKLVGQPTGGNANQTGNLAPFYLPNTKLLILAPGRYITRVSGDTRKQSVQPDVIVTKDENPAIDKTLQVSLKLFGNQ
ncbi:S41 family peptidase [Psychroserpens sp. MEBiC05023]